MPPNSTWDLLSLISLASPSRLASAVLDALQICGSHQRSKSSFLPPCLQSTKRRLVALGLRCQDPENESFHIKKLFFSTLFRRTLEKLKKISADKITCKVSIKLTTFWSSNIDLKGLMISFIGTSWISPIPAEWILKFFSRAIFCTIVVFLGHRVSFPVLKNVRSSREFAFEIIKFRAFCVKHLCALFTSRRDKWLASRIKAGGAFVLQWRQHAR